MFFYCFGGLYWQSYGYVNIFCWLKDNNNNLTDPEIASRNRFKMPEFLEPKKKQFNSSSMIFVASAIVKHLHSMLHDRPISQHLWQLVFPPGDCIRPIGLDFPIRGYEWMNTARSGKMRCHAMSNCRFCGLVVCVACATNRRCLVQIFTGLGCGLKD